MNPPQKRNPIPPVVVNLDPLGELLDRALAHPAAGLLRLLAPEVHAAVVDAREDLVGVAAHLADEVQARTTGAIDKRAAAAVRRVTGKKKRSQPKRLKR